MPITPQVDKWLQDAGYQYHCFISWPHTKSKDLTRFARKLKETVEGRLALSVPNPRVFLDEQEITVGADWQRTLMQALCRSVSMIAVCCPVYYDSSHRWCGLEWAAMHHLGNQRLAGTTFSAIIPVLVKKEEKLPPAVQALWWKEMTSGVLQGSAYFQSKDFYKKMDEIVQRIETVACTIAASHAALDCEHFAFPVQPAFAEYTVGPEPYPLVGG